MNPVALHTTTAPQVLSKAGPRQAAEEFEALMISKLLETAGLDRMIVEDEKKQKIYGHLWLESMGRTMAAGGGLGLAEELGARLSVAIGIRVGGETQ